MGEETCISFENAISDLTPLLAHQKLLLWQEQDSVLSQQSADSDFQKSADSDFQKSVDSVILSSNISEENSHGGRNL